MQPEPAIVELVQTWFSAATRGDASVIDHHVSTTITLPDGKSVSPRWTAVLVREDNAWKFVQTHASIAVSNDQVGWSYD